MKKILFILPLLLGLDLMSQTLVVTGGHKIYELVADDRNYLVRYWSRLRSYNHDYTLSIPPTIWSNDRTSENDFSVFAAYYYYADTLACTTCRHITRSGIAFDVTALPDNAVIDSVKLSLYTEADSYPNSGIVITAPPVFNGGTDSDYDNLTNHWSSLALVPYTSSAGWKTFTVNSLPIVPIYGSNYAMYGICEFNHDWLDIEPEQSSALDIIYYRVKIRNDVGYKPYLTVYYTATTPAPKQIKMISII